MKKKRILFVSKETRGGTGTFLKQIALLDDSLFVKKFYLLKKEKDFNFNVKHKYLFDLYPAHYNFSVGKIGLFIQYLIKARQSLKKEVPEIVFVCDLYPFILFSFLKFLGLNKVPLYYFMNIDIFKLIDEKPGVLYRNILSRLSLFLLGYVELVIFPSKGLMKHLEKKMTKKSYYIPYGVELVSLSKKAADSQLRIISVGRLDAQKDFATLIKAFRKVVDKKPQIELVIVGDGELRSSLEEMVKKLNLTNKVIFTGWVNDVRVKLAKADIFVFSTRYEGFGMVLLEAMAAKLPVITTDAKYGPKEIVESGKYGKIVPVGNVEDMADALLELVQSKKLREELSEVGYARAKEYSIKKMLKSYEKLIFNT